MSATRTTTAKILLIDDDAKLCALLCDYLKGFGFEADVAEDAATGLAKCASLGYDVILLDMMLPDMDGLDVLRKLREVSHTPVIIFSAQDEEISRIVGLELGADDYVPKAFSPRELLARMRAVLRRAQPVPQKQKPTEDDGFVRVRGLCLCRDAMTATMNDNPMDLTILEFRILLGMALQPGRVFTRENLLELAVGREFNRFDRSVDMHISSLRRKLGDDPHNPTYLKTVRGMGYTLLPQND